MTPIFGEAERTMMNEAVAGLALKYEPEWSERGDVVGEFAFTYERGLAGCWAVDCPPPFGMADLYDDGDAENGPHLAREWVEADSDGKPGMSMMVLMQLEARAASAVAEQMEMMFESARRAQLEPYGPYTVPS